MAGRAVEKGEIHIAYFVSSWWVKCFNPALTAEHKPLWLTLVEHIVLHPCLTDVVSTITLLDHFQPHSVIGHLFKAGEVPLPRSDQLGILEEDNFWSWETKIDTLDVQ